MTNAIFIVTGSSKGLGAALGKLIDEPVIGISRSPSSSTIDWVQADLSRDESVETCITALLEKLNNTHFDKLFMINNAGAIEPIKKIEDICSDDLGLSLSVNLKAPVRMTSSLMKWCKDHHKEIAVVNISSGVAVNPLEGWSLYSMTKAALSNFSRSIALENRGSSEVAVIDIDPGVIDTGMQESIRCPENACFGWYDNFEDFKRNDKLCSPEDIAHVIYDFLKSDFESGTYKIRNGMFERQS